MVDIPSVHNVLDISSEENLLSLAGDVAVGWAVVDDPDPQVIQNVHDALMSAWADAGADTDEAGAFWTSLASPRREDGRWRDILIGLASGVPPHRQAVVMADLCLDCITVDSDDLVAGLGVRRLNGILDILDMPFSAVDVQDFYATMAQSLAVMKANYLHDAVGIGASFAGGFAGGWFGFPGMVQATNKGVDFFTDEITKTDECSLGTAALLSCALAATEWPGGDGDVIAIRDEVRRLAEKANDVLSRYRGQSANVYTGDAAQADRHRRILNAALGVANELAGDNGDRAQLPRLIGMTLSAARDLLQNMGIELSEFDDTGQDRWVLNATNWQVASQEPRAGTETRSVKLAVRKYGE